MADELAKLLGERFIQRRDVKAWQFPGGGYTPERTPITWGDIRGHLAGKRTMGHYLVDREGLCRFFCFDIDLIKEAPLDEDFNFYPRTEFADPTSPHRSLLIGDLTHLAEGLARRINRTLDLRVAISYSGNKGVHCYALFDSPEPAAIARAAAHGVLESFGCFEAVRGDNFFRHDSEYRTTELEIFPKQSTLENDDSLGNLLRLPLGTHKKSGQRGYFISVGADPRGEFHELDPIEALTSRLPWE